MKLTWQQKYRAIRQSDVFEGERNILVLLGTMDDFQDYKTATTIKYKISNLAGDYNG